MATDTGTPLPLFPLQTVLFPGGLLGLKVFEARYVDLVTRCLRERAAFGVICLRQGVEAGRGPVALEPVGALARIFHRSRATNEYGIALVCPKIQVSNLDQRAGNAEAKLYRRN